VDGDGCTLVVLQDARHAYLVDIGDFHPSTFIPCRFNNLARKTAMVKSTLHASGTSPLTVAVPEIVLPVEVRSVSDQTELRFPWHDSEPWSGWQAPQEQVASVEDIWITSNDGRPVRLRIYRPAPSTDELLPVLIYVHGLGWSKDILDLYDSPCKTLANSSGYVTISVEHRSAPQHRFPKQLEDVLSAIQWAFEHAGTWGFNTAKIAVGGDGIGAALASASALTFRQSGINLLAHQILLFPMLDSLCSAPSYMELSNGYLISRSQMQSLWDIYLPDSQSGKSMYASPIHAEDLRNLPTSTIITGEFDPARDDGEIYSSRLNSQGVESRLIRLPNAVHGYLHLTGAIPAAFNAVNVIGTMLRSTGEKGRPDRRIPLHRAG